MGMIKAHRRTGSRVKPYTRHVNGKVVHVKGTHRTGCRVKGYRR